MASETLRRVQWVVALAMVCSCLFLLLPIGIVEASSAAGTETLIGIVGKDFVLLGADSSVSQSIALTASNLDKIAHLVDPFPDAHASNQNGEPAEASSPDGSDIQQRNEIVSQTKRQQTILAAAAGDAADSDRLLGYLKAIGSLEEYKNGSMGCDVVQVSLGASKRKQRLSNPGLDAKSMAHLARRCIWENLRTRTPYRICLLVAGMRSEEEDDDDDYHSTNELEGFDYASEPKIQGTAFLSQRVQDQVQQARESARNRNQQKESPASDSATKAPRTSSNQKSQSTNYKPSLFWLDEYGSLQDIEYGAHGHGSNFLLSILDQNYRPDLTRSQALALMKECFRELRSRYVINSPEAPCIKCVDADGVRLM